MLAQPILRMPGCSQALSAIDASVAAFPSDQSRIL